MNTRQRMWWAILLVGLGVAIHGSARANPGDVGSYTKISSSEGGLNGPLQDDGEFGSAVAWLGTDPNGGVSILGVGAPGDDNGSGAGGRGAVWILSTNDSGVLSEQKISDVDGGFFGTLDDGDRFGSSLALVGDVDGDLVNDMMVGAVGDDDGALNAGAAWLLFRRADGTVRTQQKISATDGGFSGALDGNDAFGASIVSLGDLDGDSVEDIAIGAPGDDDGGIDRGAVWILFLNTNGTVKAHQKISSTTGGLGNVLGDRDAFGQSLALLSDLDGDARPELAVGAPKDDDGGVDRGAAWVLFLDSGGTVRSQQKISSLEGGMTGALSDGDQFGSAIASVPDLNEDGVDDIAVGAHRHGNGGVNRGAIWVLFLDNDATTNGNHRISGNAGGFGDELADGDFFGRAIAGGPVVQARGVGLLVGAPGDDDGGSDRGSAWKLWLNEGQVSSSVPDRPANVTLNLPAPNPASTSASVMVQLRRPARVDLTVTDAAGREVQRLIEEDLPAGSHRILWNLRTGAGKPVPSGIYYVSVISPEGRSTQRISVIR